MYTKKTKTEEYICTQKKNKRIKLTKLRKRHAH